MATTGTQDGYLAASTKSVTAVNGIEYACRVPVRSLSQGFSQQGARFRVPSLLSYEVEAAGVEPASAAWLGLRELRAPHS